MTSPSPDRASTGPLRPVAELGCVVGPEASLLDALAAIERGAVEIALVLDADRRLLGLLTDGDVRRALLRGADLSSPVAATMQRAFAAVGEGAPRAEALDLMQARRIGQVPVVDERGRLVALHLLHDLLGAPKRQNRALVLCGGRGTRLAPLTDAIPKPMIRVAGRPILERIVLHLVSHGVTDVTLAVHYLASMVEAHFGDGARFGCRLRYLREETPLGTAGALALVGEITEPIVVMNGDLVTQADVGAMIDLHVERGHQVTVGVRRYVHRVPFGCVDVAEGRIRSIEEKPALERLVNTGIYVVSPAAAHRVPKGVPSTMPELVERCLERGESVGAHEVEGDWIDVGRHDQLREARGE